MPDPLKIIVLEGDETGQELLEQSVRVLDPELLGVELELENYDLSLEHRRETSNEVVHEAARAMREAGYGLKAATITPEGKDDVGSPNRILREEVDGKVIVRVGRRIPGVVGPGLRRAPPDLGRADGRRGRLRRQAVARGRARAPTTRSPTGRRRSRAPPAARSPSTRSARPSAWAARRRSTAGRSGRSPPSTRACSRRSSTRPRRAIPDVRYQPVLIDATYAGLMTGATETPLVIPALNRDGDCLSDLVLPMFGSIAGAESILLAFDDDYEIDVAMAEAPHGTAPSLMGKDLANPMAMLLACGALLQYAARQGPSRAPSGPRAPSTRACWRPTAGGVKTIDLGGHATTTEFTDAVVEKVRTKVDIWSSLGSR